MIEIHNHLIGSHIPDKTHHTITLGSHHRHGIARLDHLIVKLTVDDKYITLKLYNMLRIIITESIGRGHFHLKSITLPETLDSTRKRLDKPLRHTKDNLLRIIHISLMHKFLATLR